jgi:hypothetical protein
MRELDWTQFCTIFAYGSNILLNGAQTLASLCICNDSGF